MPTSRRGLGSAGAIEDDDEDDGRSVLQAFRDTPTAVLASDERGRLVFWNHAAEKLLERSSGAVLGRRCGETLQARDVFGNRYCGEDCPVLDMSRRNEPVRSFEWQIAGAAGDRPRKARVQILRVPGSGPGEYTLVHLLEPVDEEARLREVLSVLSARAAGEGGIAAPKAAWSAAPAPPLTPREQDVLAGIASGRQNKEIAVELGISPATVRNHVHAILEKLQVHSKLEALSLAVSRGWVGPSPGAKP